MLRVDEAKGFALTMIAMYLFVLLSVLCSGCASATTQAKRAGIGASYGDRVMDCSDQAVAAQDPDVYERCMDDVDVRFGKRPAPTGGGK